LSATGLAADSAYTLVLNGIPGDPVQSDAAGKLVIDTQLSSPLDVLSLETLELWDASNTPVLATTFP
jgi:hypothetical protein